MYFTFFTSPPLSGAERCEQQPLLPLASSAAPLKTLSTLSSHARRHLTTTLALLVGTLTFVRFTSTARAVPPESLLILLALPSLVVPLAHGPTRRAISALSPTASARLLSHAIFLAIALYTALSAVSLQPAAIAASLASLAPLFALALSALLLRSRSAVNPSLAALLLLPSTALAVAKAVPLAGFPDAFSAGLLSAVALAAACLVASDHIPSALVALCTSACCGALALVFADGIALRRAVSLAAFNSAVFVGALAWAWAGLVRVAPHLAAVVPGLAAPLVAALSALLLAEVPAISAVVGLVAGAAVSAVLAALPNVRQTFDSSASTLFAAPSIKV